MTVHQENLKKGLVDWLTSVAKTISAISIVIGAVWFTTKPVVEPYLDIPDKLDGAISEITQLDIKLSASKHLQFLTFVGNGLITSQTRESLELLYIISRKVSCDTKVLVRFWEVDKGYFAYTHEVPAYKSPVTEIPQPFKVLINLPSTLPEGRYIYLPTLTPIDCGVYETTVVPPPSSIFEYPGEPS